MSEVALSRRRRWWPGRRNRPTMDKAVEVAAGRAPDATALGWLVAGLALVIVPHLIRLPVWYFPVLALAAFERLSHEFTRRKPFPAWARLALTVVAVAMVAVHYGTLLGRQAGVALLCIMIALKLLETYRRRDVYLLVALSYFVAVTQFLYSQSIYLVVYVFACVMFITGTLVVIELQPSRVRGRRESGGGIKALLRNVGLMLAQAIPLMLLMFILVPRLSTPIWGMPQDALDAKTGVSGEMSPGSVLNLFLNDQPAFRAQFSGGNVPSNAERYWRGPVLWSFDGRTWTRPDVNLRSPATVDSEPGPRSFRYRITLEPTEQNWLFGLDYPMHAPPEGGMQLDHMLYSQQPIIELKTYSMVSDPDYVMDPELSLLRRYAALALPDGYDPRTREMAAQWRAEAGDDDAAIVQRALDMFTNEQFFYSYTPPPLGRNTADDFLFSTRSGYCEHYSSVFTILMRAAGIPARVVAGYLGGWYNESGDYVLVRQSDAHAWSEVWLEGQGWVRVDPTAAVNPDRVDLGAYGAAGQRRSAFDFAWLRSLRNQLDGLHNFWNEWIVKFNQARQRSLLQPFGVDDFKPQSSMFALLALGGLMLLFVGRWLLRRQRIGGLDPAAREYARFCRKLSRAGVQREVSEGPLAFAQRALLARPKAGRAVLEITRLYVAARYAAGASSGQLDKLRDAVRKFKVAA